MARGRRLKSEGVNSFLIQAAFLYKDSKKVGVSKALDVCVQDKKEIDLI